MQRGITIASKTMRLRLCSAKLPQHSLEPLHKNVCVAGILGHHFREVAFR